jgi:hypothetical protein
MRILYHCSLLLTFLALHTNAWAFDKNARPLGLGVEIGDPTGISAKYYIERQVAAQAGFGFFGWPSGGGIHIDLLYEFPDAINTSREGFELPLYFGAGLKAGGFVRCRNAGIGNDCDTDLIAGFRVPFGAALQLKNSPLELQLEFAPVFFSQFDFGLGVEGDLMLAARYYF